MIAVHAWLGLNTFSETSESSKASVCIDLSWFRKMGNTVLLPNQTGQRSEPTRESWCREDTVDNHFSPRRCKLQRSKRWEHHFKIQHHRFGQEQDIFQCDFLADAWLLCGRHILTPSGRFPVFPKTYLFSSNFDHPKILGNCPMMRLTSGGTIKQKNVGKMPNHKREINEKLFHLHLSQLLFALVKAKHTKKRHGQVDSFWTQPGRFPSLEFMRPQWWGPCLQLTRRVYWHGSFQPNRFIISHTTPDFTSVCSLPVCLFSHSSPVGAISPKHASWLAQRIRTRRMKDLVFNTVPPCSLGNVSTELVFPYQNSEIHQKALVSEIVYSFQKEKGKATKRAQRNRNNRPFVLVAFEFQTKVALSNSWH